MGLSFTPNEKAFRQAVRTILDRRLPRYEKMGFLEHEHSNAINVMRNIKLVLDPDNRMKPAKVVRAMLVGYHGE